MLSFLRSRNGLIALSLVLLSSLLAWWWLHLPKRLVHLRMARLAEICSFKADDSELVRMGKARALGGLVADPLLLKIPVDEVSGTRSREEIQGWMVSLVKTAKSASLALGPEAFEQVGGDAASLRAPVIAVALFEEGRNEKREFPARFLWRKTGGEWQLQSVEKTGE